jgi:CheY-like chemotaxis protein
MILQQVFAELDFNVSLHFVGNGEDVMDYLLRRNAYTFDTVSPRPALVLMDLNMPLMNGHEALQAIRANEALRAIPVVILSTSDNPEQIARAYASGVNAFMTKPGPYQEFLDLMQTFGSFWLTCARLPTIVG